MVATVRPTELALVRSDGLHRVSSDVPLVDGLCSSVFLAASSIGGGPSAVLPHSDATPPLSYNNLSKDSSHVLLSSPLTSSVLAQSCSELAL